MLLHPTEEQVLKLKELADASSELWNMANYDRRQALFSHTKMPTYNQQFHKFKTTEPYQKLGTCKSQALLYKLKEAWSSFWALKRLQAKGRLPPNITKVSPPHYWKEDGERLLKAIYVRNDGYTVGEGMISISKDLKIPYASGMVRAGKQGRLEITIDSGKWYAHMPSEVETPQIQTRSKRAKLDLGICNLAALTMDGRRPVVYSGRAVLSDWVYHTKKISERQSRLPRRQHTSKWINGAYRRRRLRQRHAIRAMCRDIFERLDPEDVGELVVGNPYGVRDESIGKKGNQKRDLFWAYGQTLAGLHELGEEYGIRVTEPSEEDGGERNTSKTCYFCGTMHPNARVKRGLYVCRTNHIAINADVNGSLNMDMNVAVDRPPVRSTNEKVDSGSRLLAQPLLLRWNYNVWS